MSRWFLLAICVFVVASPVRAETMFVEAESFREHGGWSLETSFTTIVGSPYLMAHGMGRPVKDAETTVKKRKGKQTAVVGTSSLSS